MNAAIDVGNTCTKIGFFQENRLVACRNQVPAERIIKILETFDVQKVIISNVGKKNTSLYAQLIRKYGVLDFNYRTPLPIKHQYLTPETLGADRLAAVVGAFALYPHEHNLVIDMGTCITCDFIHKNGVYLGGSIAPGLSMRLQSLHYFTARLPLVERATNVDLHGNTTVSCIRSGVIYAVRLELQGFISAYTKKYHPLNVLLCGGDAIYFETKIKAAIFAHSNLTLYGLNEILNWNE